LEITVTLKDETIDEALKARAEAKARHLLKYYDKIQSIRVVLDKSGQGYTCEMIADLERMHDLVAKTTEHDPVAALEEAHKRLERQVRDHKDRTRHRKGRGPSPHQPPEARP